MGRRSKEDNARRMKGRGRRRKISNAWGKKDGDERRSKEENAGRMKGRGRRMRKRTRKKEEEVEWYNEEQEKKGIRRKGNER